MATISRKNVSEDSMLRLLKYKTHKDILVQLNPSEKKDANREFIDPLPLGKFEVPESPLDLWIEVTLVNYRRLDLIAWKYYGNVKLWWVIAMVNDIIDPWTDLEPGDLIRIPTSMNVFNALRNHRKIQELS